MENKCTLFRVVGLTQILLASSSLSAEGMLGGSLYALTGESDNAFKSEIDTVDERQDEYGLDVDGAYVNSFIDSSISYLTREQQFAEESQENKSTLEGKSSLLIGKDYHPIDLLLTHSRTSLLKEPDQISLTNNQDAREIFSVIPTLRGRLTGVDIVQLTADFTDIKFLETDQLDSSRQGASLAWIRRSSSVQQLQLVVQTMGIEFDDFEQSNYTYRKVMLGYTAALRKINYKIDLGYNQSDPQDGESQSGPAYNASVGYKTGMQEIELTSSQTITDSSFGNGNQGTINELPGSDGSSGDASRLERRDTQIRWATSGLCIKCSLSVAIFMQNNDYLQQDKKSRQSGGNVRLAYNFSNAAALSLGYSRSEQKSEGDEAERNFDLSVLSAEYRYNFINDLGFRLLISDEKRSSEIFMDDYSERYVGVGINYNF